MLSGIAYRLLYVYFQFARLACVCNLMRVVVCKAIQQSLFNYF